MPATSNLVGCSLGSSLFSINPATGAGTVIGPTGFLGLNSLACDSSGTLHSVSGPSLIKMDASTGAGTFVKALQPITDIRALAFSPTNVLFAIRNGGGPTGTENPDDLVRIDVTTGTVTLVGNTQRSALQALDFSANGTLYGWDISIGLVTIDTTTGVATPVNPATIPGTVPDVQGLAFASDGTLFGARDSLFTIDLNTGHATLVGSGGYSDVRGIAFLDKVQSGSPLDDLRHIYSDVVKLIGSRVQAGGSGYGITLGGRVIPIPPFDPEVPWKHLSQEQQDVLVASSVSSLLAALFSSSPRG